MIYLNYILFQLLPYDIAILNNYSNYLNNLLYNNNDLNKFISLNNNNILFVSSKIWDGNLAYNSHITSIGNIMYTNYSMWLIIASFILLLALVGCVIITTDSSERELGSRNITSSTPRS